MWKVLPAYWFLPFWIGLPSLFICICKGGVETSAKLTFLGKRSNWFFMFLRQTAGLGLISVCHYWLHRLLIGKYRLPAFPLNLLFAGLLFETFGLALYDFEYARINMMMILPSIFTAYAGRMGRRATMWTDPVLFAGARPVTGSSALNVVIGTILDMPVLWTSIILFVGSWIGLSVFLVYKFRRVIAASMSFKMGKYSVKLNRTSGDEERLVWKPAHPYKNVPFILSHVLACLSVILLFSALFSRSNFKLALFSQLPYFEALLLAFTHFEKFTPDIPYSDFIKTVRHYLPPGRRWLDTRPTPVYPAVHGDMEAFCAYNPTEDECKGFVAPEKKPLTKMPNVVFIAYESLTPSFNLISKEFIKEHTDVGPGDKRAMVTDTLYFSEEVMPNMRRYQKDAVTFSGTASLGIPTASGLVGLFTGIPPAQSYGIIVDATLLHSDDLASAMRNIGYRSFLVSSAEFSFDGQSNWFFKRSAKEEALNRMKCIEGQEELLNDPLHMELLRRSPSGHVPKLVNCNPKKVDKLTKKLRAKGLDVPKWYDIVYNYYPLGGMADLVNLTRSTVRTQGTTWPADRLTAQMFKRHWQQAKEILQRKGESKPIFGTYITIESHVPYFSYDKEEYYDPIKDEVWKDHERLREARFVRVNKYADQYGIKPVLDFLKETDPHTIFVITGDHGTRDIPIRDTDSEVFDDIVYSSDCVHHSSGTDSFYITSSMIGYLGDDPVVKKIMGLDKNAGKTVKIPNDHGDVIYTLFDILTRINGSSPPPTHRRSRNLLNLTSQLCDTIDKQGVKAAADEIDNSGWHGISAATFNLEYREGMKVLRSHPSDPSGAHLYNQTSFPLCMRKKSQPPMKLGTPDAKRAYERMFNFLQAENHLSYHNRMYNYGFRNTECYAKKECEWAEPTPLRFNDAFFIKILIMIPFSVFMCVAVPAEIFVTAKWYLEQHSQELIDGPGNHSDDPLCVGDSDSDNIDTMQDAIVIDPDELPGTPSDEFETTEQL